MPGVQKNTHPSREARYFIKVLTKAPTGPYRQPDESSPHLRSTFHSQNVSVFCMDITTNRGDVPMQHSTADFYGKGMCLLRDTK